MGIRSPIMGDVGGFERGCWAQMQALLLLSHLPSPGNQEILMVSESRLKMSSDMFPAMHFFFWFLFLTKDI